MPSSTSCSSVFPPDTKSDFPHPVISNALNRNVKNLKTNDIKEHIKFDFDGLIFQYNKTYIDNGNATTHIVQRTCIQCGATSDETGNHVFETEWTRTETHHYHACTLCGYKKDFDVHQDTNSDLYCDICEYNMLSVTLIATIDNENDILYYSGTSNCATTNPAAKYELFYESEATAFATINTSSNEYSGTLNPATRFVFGNRGVTAKVTRQDGATATTTITVEVLMIRTRADLVQLATNVNGGNTYEGKELFVMADINMGGSGSGSFTPIGKQDYPFNGSFDGKNHTISNFYISSTGVRQGLFGLTGADAVIKDFTISGTIANCGQMSGTVVAQNWGTIENVTSSVSISAMVSGKIYAGGIVGCNDGCGNKTGIISNCTYTGSIAANRIVGGIVGIDYGGTIENCVVGISGSTRTIAASHVTSGDTGMDADDKTCLGGIVGAAKISAGYLTEVTTITNCTNYATISATGTTNYRWGTGGIVGWSNCNITIDNCNNSNSFSIINKISKFNNISKIESNSSLIIKAIPKTEVIIVDDDKMQIKEENKVNVNSTKQVRKKIICMHEFSKTGYAGEDEKKINQDNYFVFHNFVNNLNYIFMAVCDGHGAVGQEISSFLKENLPIDLNHALRNGKKDILNDDISDIITNIFIQENNKLISNEMINSVLSGSTCVSAIYTPIKLITANVGDSRIILGKYFQNLNKWLSLDLTRDHKPSLPEEEKRILEKGGRIEPMKDEDNTFIGPPRVWLKEQDYPGLAMSRSFGDRLAHSVGVSEVPEIKDYFFAKEDKFFVVASDGLFEFVSSQKIVEVIKDFYINGDIVGCCEYLYKLSRNKWMKEEEVVDDITMILVFLEDE